MIGSDGLPHDAYPHPRLWGTFPRVLGHYARDLGLFSLEEAVHKMTGHTAEVFGMADRGVIRAGAYADLVLFDPATVRDASTYDAPTQPAEGILETWVNGQSAYVRGRGDRGARRPAGDAWAGVIGTCAARPAFSLANPEPGDSAMRNGRLCITAALAAGLALPALAAGPTPQTVQKNGPNTTGKLFPKNQPVPPYAVSGANNEQGGVGNGHAEPNAGATGLNGSAGTGTGWTAPAYKNGSTQR